MVDYQGNSKKEKETAKNPPKKNLEKVVSGDVSRKPKTIGSRFKTVFFGGDINTAAQYVMTDVLLPALRNLVVDTIAKGTDRLVYGDSVHRRRPTGYGPRVQYNNPIHRNSPSITYPQRSIDRWAETRKTFEDVIVGTKEDAETVVERMTDIVDMYQVVSVADLYELLGLPSTHVDHKWGWTQLTSIEIKQVREGYRITFPPLEEIE